jgi:hypothetical protein
MAILQKYLTENDPKTKRSDVKYAYSILLAYLAGVASTICHNIQMLPRILAISGSRRKRNGNAWR